MAKLSMESKKMMVEEISRRLSSADTMLVTNYKGLSAQDLNVLRKELRNISSEYVVVKDSMLKRALTKEPSNRIMEFVEGEVGIALYKEGDPSHLSKVLVKFAKNHEVLEIRGGMVNGEPISKDDVKQLAALPSREVLLGKLANVLNAPIQGLAGVLSAIICKLLYALNAVKDKKGQEKPEEKVEDKKEEVQTRVEKKAEPQADKKEETQPEKKEEPCAQTTNNEQQTTNDENKEGENG